MYLPRPIELYFASDRSDDPDARATSFAANVTVIDEGRVYATITAWSIEAKHAYHYRVELLEALQGDGQTVDTARPAGDFPGSPVTLAYVFALERDKIVSLEIRS